MVGCFAGLATDASAITVVSGLIALGLVVLGLIELGLIRGLGA